MNILGIETSCDEAGLAFMRDGRLVAQALSSHADVCAQHGGVLPEVVAREHMRVLPHLAQKMFMDNSLKWSDVDAVAVTSGPGLISSLLIGCGFARGLSRSLRCPLVGINHLRAHVLVARMENDVRYPFIALLISGGHTALYRVNAPDQFDVLGQTYDDALGEAFDKVARLLGIPYPGGARLEALAREGKELLPFPKPLLNRDSLDFSFSGLKASIARYVEQHTLTDELRENIAYSFQESVAEVVAKKVYKAFEQNSDAHSVVLTGGVAANTRLRQAVRERLPENVPLCCPSPKFCTDNGVMIAWAAHELYRCTSLQRDFDVVAHPNMPL